MGRLGPVIRCAECKELVPAERVRHREERVKLAAPASPGRWRAGGPPIFRARPAPQRGARDASAADGQHPSYAVERVPVCLECLRRQRKGLAAVCGITALCVLAAFLVFSRDREPPNNSQPQLASLSVTSQPSSATGPAASSTTTKAKAAPVSPAPPVPAPALADASPEPTPTPASPPAPAARPNPPLPAASEPATRSPTSDSLAAAFATDVPPVWTATRKTGQRKPPPAARHAAAAAPKAVSLRSDGYAELTRRRYAQALSLLEQSTMLGDAYAPMYIGQLFESGAGVPRDVGQASYWYGIAINRSNAEALAAFNRLRMNPY